jgi:glycosyltransferase involved in cell wall biosynthesis
LDSAKHLSIGGRYPRFAAQPDRWISWWLGAVPKGLAMIRKYRPHVIWSTYPIATAHKIGHTLHRLSGLPWIADFRDPMAQPGYPADRRTWHSFKRIEEAALRSAQRNVFVTTGAARFYQEGYPEVSPDHIAVIENGYDEETFDGLDAGTEPLIPGAITLLHSGVVYPSERDPTQLFDALRQMRDSGALPPGKLRVRLRAPGHEPLLRSLIATAGIGELVELAPPIPYRDALREMIRADGLLLLQASNCNDQVPAKAYEYLRCGRPVLALTDPTGDTAELLRRAGLHNIARLDSAEDIARALQSFIADLTAGRRSLPDARFVKAASRLDRTKQLAALLEGLQPARHG